MITIPLPLERCRESAIVPQYKHSTDACMDLYAAENVTIRPGETMAVGIGWKPAIPENVEMHIRSRSGLALNTPLRIANGMGTIDTGYRDEIKVILHNTSDLNSANKIFNLNTKGCQHGTYQIKVGDRIAQMQLLPIPRIQIKEVKSVAVIGKDREGGLGSTGIR